MKKLKIITSHKKKGIYEAEIWKVEDGIYNYRILLNHKEIAEEKKVHYADKKKLDQEIKKIFSDFDREKGSVWFINELDRIVRKHTNKQWDMIKERDEYKCQLCGRKRDINIDIHHIISVDRYIRFLSEKLDINNITYSKKIMQYFTKWIINRPFNLITLCKKCHKQDINTKFTILMERAIRNTINSRIQLMIPAGEVKELKRKNVMLIKTLRDNDINNFKL